MPGKIPEGYIDLKQAFDAYYERQFGIPVHEDKADDRARRERQAFAELRQAFQQRELQVSVRFDSDAENMSLPPDGWGSDDFELDLFNRASIGLSGRSGRWNAYQGQVPFVSEREFDQWALRITGRHGVPSESHRKTGNLEPLKKPKRYAIEQAVTALWSGKVPSELMKKERDTKIMEWCKQQSLPVPAERTLRDFFNGGGLAERQNRQ